MPDETSTGSAGASHRRRHSSGSSGQQSPLQARAAFLQNRSWESVISFNRAACERGRAQHGLNSETQEALAREWETKRAQVFSLDEPTGISPTLSPEGTLSLFQWKYLC